MVKQHTLPTPRVLRLVSRYAYLCRLMPKCEVPKHFYKRCLKTKRYEVHDAVAYGGGFWLVHHHAQGYGATDADRKARAYAKWRKSAAQTIVPQKLETNRQVDRKASPIESDPFCNSTRAGLLRIYQNRYSHARVELRRNATSYQWAYYKPSSIEPYAIDVVSGLIEFETMVEAGAFGKHMRLAFPLKQTRSR